METENWIEKVGESLAIDEKDPMSRPLGFPNSWSEKLDYVCDSNWQLSAY